ncbi:MAG: HEAT repeat domain-containing protein [Proteobacteria bacterium]|nr:HEAT repeat domain-containing protein [Verrucomicrobiota bacterium]NBU11216.1 HEAT repeat domain-containing protein [Pseudomonadota bacterium]
MGFYVLIHWVSLALAGATLAILSAAVVRQWFRQRRSQRDAQRRESLMALALEYIEEPEFLPAFKAQLRPEDQRLLVELFAGLLPKVRGDYAEKVVHLMREMGLRDRCLRQMNSPKWWKRADAAAVLGWFNEPQVITALSRAMDDPQVDVRLEAARALTRLGAVQSVAGLVARLAVVDASHSLGVKEIFRSLGTGAVPELINVLDSDVSDQVKMLAADALGHIGDARAVPALLKLFRTQAASPDPTTQLSPKMRRGETAGRPGAAVNASVALRLAVMQALSVLVDPRALDAILAALDDPVWEVRAQAAHCASQLGSVDAVPRLTSLLNDEHWWVRFHAAEALFRLGAAGRASLLQSARGASARAADMAAGLLREKGVAV